MAEKKIGELLKGTRTDLERLTSQPSSAQMTKEVKIIGEVFRYKDAKLSDFNQNMGLIRYCQEWCKKPQHKPAPFVIGSVGNGKTHLLNAIKHELWLNGFITIDDKKAVTMKSATELIYEIKSAITTNSSDDVLETYKHIPILLLDDIGADRVTEWSQEQFYIIIDYRWRYTLPTVVTSNYSMEKISEMLGERITSRLVGMTKLFKLIGEDRRLKNK